MELEGKERVFKILRPLLPGPGLGAPSLAMAGHLASDVAFLPPLGGEATGQEGRSRAELTLGSG